MSHTCMYLLPSNGSSAGFARISTAQMINKRTCKTQCTHTHTHTHAHTHTHKCTRMPLGGFSLSIEGLHAIIIKSFGAYCRSGAVADMLYLTS